MGKAVSSLVSQGGPTSLVSREEVRWGHVSGSWGDAAAPLSLWGQTSGPGMILLSLSVEFSKSTGIDSLGFELSWDTLPFFLSYYSYLQRDCLSYACPSIVFWECIICLGSRGNSWGRMCLRIKHTLSLTYIWFGAYVDDILDMGLMLGCIKILELLVQGKCTLHVRNTGIWQGRVWGKNVMAWIAVP